MEINTDIHKMKLHDFIQFDYCSYLRVPNGWICTIYRLDAQQMNSVFVPINHEFQDPNVIPF
jgi:hypothetical protein